MNNELSFLWYVRPIAGHHCIRLRYDRPVSKACMIIENLKNLLQSIGDTCVRLDVSDCSRNSQVAAR